VITIASETLMLKPNFANTAGSSLSPLAARDFLGGSNGGIDLSPKSLLPLNAPDVRSGGRFRQMLGAANLRPLAAADHIPGVRKGKTDQSQHDALTEQAQKWVAQTFYGTLLKQMHDSPFKSELFAGGRGAEAFQPLMDQHLIDRMAKSSNNQKLVRGIVRQIEGRQAYRKQNAESEDQKREPAAIPKGKQIPFDGRVRVAPGLRA
jgi:hypothetical protein